MNCKIDIRIANVKDSENIIQLVKTGLEEFGYDYDPKNSEGDIENLNDGYLSNNGAFLVGFSGSEILATGGLQQISEVCYKIRKMYVDRRHRGKGLGKRMLFRLEEEAVRRGGLQLILETTEKMKAAINLYRSAGFSITNEYIESSRCTISMIKELKYTAYDK